MYLLSKRKSKSWVVIDQHGAYVALMRGKTGASVRWKAERRFTDPVTLKRVHFTRSVWEIWRIGRGLCHLCKQAVPIDVGMTHPKAPSIDHVRPRSRGGTRNDGIALAHRWCNSRRGDRPLDEIPPEVYATMVNAAAALVDREIVRLES